MWHLIFHGHWFKHEAITYDAWGFPDEVTGDCAVCKGTDEDDR